MILVTGATGNIGRPLVDLLSTEGADVRAVTRNPQAADLPADVEVVEADPSRPDTVAFATALHGVKTLFLSPVAVQDAYREVLALAREAGVRRVVALSAINVGEPLDDQPSRLRGARHKEVDDLLGSGEFGFEWTALRSSWYGTNAIGMWAAQIRPGGDTVYGPHAGSAWSPIHEHDIAAVAVRALLTDELLGQRPVLTGPESLTFAEMVSRIGDALGRPVRYQEVPPQAAKRAMIERGFPFPESFIDGMLALQEKTVGVPAVTTPDVEKILGRPARSFAQWAEDYAGAFRGA